jgi:hypothetical protein
MKTIMNRHIPESAEVACSCPEIMWTHIEWPPNDPTGAVFRYPHCEALIAERHKAAIIAAGRWRVTRPGAPKVCNSIPFAARKSAASFAQLALASSDIQRIEPEAGKALAGTIGRAGATSCTT